MVKTGQTWSGIFVSLDATGALATPTVGPAGTLYVDGVSNAASVTVTGSNPYKWTVTLPTLTAGQCVSMYITATIATIATASVVAEDVADTVRLSDVPAVNVTLWKGTAPADLDASGRVDASVGEMQDDVIRGEAYDRVGAYPITNAMYVALDDLGNMIETGGSGDVTYPRYKSYAVEQVGLRAPVGTAAAGSLSDQLDDLSTATAACASVAANSTDATASGAITRKRGNSWSIALTLGAITGYTSLWFTIKRSTDDADSAALLQVKLNSPSAVDGLLYVNGAAATNAALGSITVSDATTGAIIVAVDETITDDLYPGSYYYDAQALISGAVTTPDSGTFTITADVTRSVA